MAGCSSFRARLQPGYRHLAVRRPDLVQAVIAHKAAWRASRHLPNTSQLAAVAKIGWLALRGRHGDAAETLLRAAYTYLQPRGTPFPKNGGGSPGKRPGGLAGLPKLHRQLSISGGSGECCGPRRVQLGRTQPQQHHPPDPLPGSGHPHCQNASN